MSFFHAIGHAFGKLFSKAPTWTQQASATLRLIAPLTTTIVLLSADGDDAAKASKTIDEVQKDLSLAATLIDHAQANGNDPATIKQVNDVLTSVSGNITDLLSAVHVKNPGTKTKIEVAVKTISGEVQAIINELPTTKK